MVLALSFRSSESKNKTLQSSRRGANFSLALAVCSSRHGKVISENINKSYASSFAVKITKTPEDAWSSLGANNFKSPVQKNGDRTILPELSKNGSLITMCAPFALASYEI